VTCPKSWCGDVSRPRWSPSRFPGVLPGPSPRWRRDRRAWCGRRCRESAFEAAHGFVGRLAGGDFPVVVGTSLCGVAQLDHGHHVKNPVDLAVPAPGQAVTDVVAGGGVNRGGAGPGREVALGREPGNVTDLDQQPGGAGGADAVQAEQCGACLFDQGGELLVRGLLARVDPRPLLLTAFSCLRLDGGRLVQEGTASTSRAFPSSASPARRWPGQRMPNESHTTHVDSRRRATTPTT
jgi:hypothetical protein